MSKPNRACSACGATTREVDPALVDPANGQLLVGTIRLSVQKRLNNSPSSKGIKESSETRRYCPKCSARLEALLRELGLKFRAA